VREEWQTDGRKLRQPPAGSWTTGSWTTGSWTTQRLLGSGVVVAVVALVVGTGLGRLLAPSTVAASGVVATEVAGAIEVPGTPAPETEIADAASLRRNGPSEPAPTGQLVVVQVSVSACDARSLGSGVVVADGLLLTAAHVVGDAGLVRIDYRGVTVTGEVLGVLGDGRDVALVAVDAPVSTPVAVGSVPEPGESLTLVGHNGGGILSAAVGPIVELAPVVEAGGGAGEIIGVDVPIDAGISGGPAVDATGAIVGLVVAKETSTDTALVVALPDLAAIGSAGLVPGECPETA
jgi:Trypsin-like peptidase domain